MIFRRFEFWAIVLFLGTISAFPGCAEGPLWRTGYLSPWVREKWNEEHRVQATYATKKAELRELVKNANKGSDSQKRQVAKQLGQIVEADPVLLLRIEAVKLLGQLDFVSGKLDLTIEPLRKASQDPEPDVRKAAIAALKNRGDQKARMELQGIVSRDTNLDVRLAATRALGNYTDNDVLRALAPALDDKNPAIQYRATKSLRDVTGQDFGEDVLAWKEYIRSKIGNPTETKSFDVQQTSGIEDREQNVSGAFVPDGK